MTDEQPAEVRPLHFTVHRAYTIDDWPQAIPVTEELLKAPHTVHATLDGDDLRFAIGNGEAHYRINRNRRHGRGYVAELVEGNDKGNLASRARKYQIRGDES